MQIRTANATQFQDESDEEYRIIYQELRKTLTLRKFVEYIGSSMSHATWDKYDKDPKMLTRRMRQELRRAVKLPPLPPTVQEAISDVDADATVAVLDETAGDLNLVVLGNLEDERWLRLISIPNRPARVRGKMARPVADERQIERRAALDVSWREVLEAGLAILEAKAKR